MFALLRSLFGASAPASALDDIRRMSWDELEYCVREGFRRRGFSQGVTPATGIVDIVLHNRDEAFFVHCKQWRAASVGVKALRELAAAITAGHAAGGFFAATGTLSVEAADIAKRANIEILDAHALEILVLDARRPEPFMDPTEGRRRTSFKKLAPDPSCPLCGGAMQKKTVTGGAHQGTHFWSCLQHPQCRGKLDA